MKSLLSITIFMVSCGIGFLGCQSQPAHNADECIDPSKINEDAICTMEYAPVCGCNDITYGNACQAENAGVLKWTTGECDS
jgi:hypothetical protein